jgi:aspartate-semialdehyde dehydrogenase
LHRLEKSEKREKAEHQIKSHPEGFCIAILGVTGLVGQAMLRILEVSHIPIRHIVALASARSAGQTLLFRNRPVRVIDVEHYAFEGVDFALFSAGGEVSAQYAPVATAADAIVIDNTSYFRYHAQIPLVIPEVNRAALSQYRNQLIVANPNCSTMQMLVALKPLYDRYGIRKITVSTYQSVSGSGQKGIVALQNELAQIPSAQPCYPAPIAFNVIPQIDRFLENHYTKEEMKMVWETQKILGDANIRVNPTAVRVPVLVGHSLSVWIETRSPVDRAGVCAALAAAPGVCVLSEDDAYPTPRLHGEGTDPVYVGRIRQEIDNPFGMNLWIVADNIRKGAALNSIQILECLIDDFT